MVQRVDSHGLNFHFEQRARSTIELSEAMRVLATMGVMNADTAFLIKDIGRQLDREARSDQMLLALWRLAILTGAAGTFDLPEEPNLIITTRFEPRARRL